MHPLLLLLYSFAVALFSISTPSFAYENEALRGFSVDLIHRNSPLSPSYKSSSCGDKSYETRLKSSAGNYTYLMRVKVGDDDDENHEIFATLDTGSNIIWLNGEKCEGNACTTRTKLKAHHIGPEYEQALCDKCSECSQIYSEGRPICRTDICHKEKICPYKVIYGDNFTTTGVLTPQVFSFPCSDGKDRPFHNIWFGVSNYSNGTFPRDSAGIVGLGRGELSLLGQLTAKGGFDFKFSYCLPKHAESVSNLSFGDHVKIPEGKYSAKLLDTTTSGYYVNLMGIHVNNEEKRVEKNYQKIMIDSGSTLTYLNEELFKFFNESVKKEMGKNVETRNISDFDVCYKPDEKKNIPTVKFEFEGSSSSSGGVTVELKKDNYLEEVPYNNTKYLCLMVGKAGNNEHQILGSRAQMGFMVAFDITSHQVSFDPDHDCDKKKNLKSLAFDITRQEQDDCGKQNVKSLLSE